MVVRWLDCHKEVGGLNIGYGDPTSCHSPKTCMQVHQVHRKAFGPHV